MRQHYWLSNKFSLELLGMGGVSATDPVFEPWNIMNCLTNSFVGVTVEETEYGAVFGFDIYPYSGATDPQTIFAIHDVFNLINVFTFELYADGTLGGSSYSSTEGWI